MKPSVSSRRTASPAVSVSIPTPIRSTAKSGLPKRTTTTTKPLSSAPAVPSSSQPLYARKQSIAESIVSSALSSPVPPSEPQSPPSEYSAAISPTPSHAALKGPVPPANPHLCSSVQVALRIRPLSSGEVARLSKLAVRVDPTDPTTVTIVEAVARDPVVPGAAAKEKDVPPAAAAADGATLGETGASPPPSPILAMPTPDTFFGGSASAIPGATARKEYQAFTFDHVYNDDASQEDLFECTQPLIEKFLNGFNATVLAYGQTGSGKTFTMGSAETSSAMTLPSTDSSLRAKLGIIPRAGRYIFETLNRNRRLSDDPTANLYMTYAVKISFLELYNEDLVDLLADPPAPEELTPGAAPKLPEWNGSFAAKNAVQRKKPKSTGAHGEKGIMIRDAKDGSIYVAGLEEKACATVDDVLKYLNKGTTLRRTSSTVMNEQSSRSHAILTLHLYQQKHYVPLTVDVTHMPEARHIVRTVTSLSKFHFVDLAGSERLKRTNATGDRQKEGISINGGLLALGKVISALADRDMAAPNHEKEDGGSGMSIKAKIAAVSQPPQEVHIPYRNSKLTRILKDSLGGNSQTLMIACVSPAHDDLFETLSTLRYAARARQIKNNVKSNTIEDHAKVEKMKLILISVQDELRRVKYESESRAVEAENAALAFQQYANQTLIDYHSAVAEGVAEQLLISTLKDNNLRLKSQKAEIEARLESVLQMYSQQLSDYHYTMSLHQNDAVANKETVDVLQHSIEEHTHVIATLRDDLAALEEASERERRAHASHSSALEAFLRDRERELGQMAVNNQLQETFAMEVEQKRISEGEVYEQRVAGLKDRMEALRMTMEEQKELERRVAEGYLGQLRSVEGMLVAEKAQGEKDRTVAAETVKALEKSVRDVELKLSEERARGEKDRAAAAELKKQMSMRIVEIEKELSRERERAVRDRESAAANEAALQEKARVIEERLASENDRGSRDRANAAAMEEKLLGELKEVQERLSSEQARGEQDRAATAAAASKFESELHELRESLRSEMGRSKRDRETASTTEAALSTQLETTSKTLAEEKARAGREHTAAIDARTSLESQLQDVKSKLDAEALQRAQEQKAAADVKAELTAQLSDIQRKLQEEIATGHQDWSKARKREAELLEQKQKVEASLEAEIACRQRAKEAADTMEAQLNDLLLEVEGKLADEIERGEHDRKAAEATQAQLNAELRKIEAILLAEQERSDRDRVASNEMQEWMTGRIRDIEEELSVERQRSERNMAAAATAEASLLANLREVEQRLGSERENAEVLRTNLASTEEQLIADLVSVRGKLAAEQHHGERGRKDAEASEAKLLAELEETKQKLSDENARGKRERSTASSMEASLMAQLRELEQMLADERSRGEHDRAAAELMKSRLTKDVHTQREAYERAVAASEEAARKHAQTLREQQAKAAELTALLDQVSEEYTKAVADAEASSAAFAASRAQHEATIEDLRSKLEDVSRQHSDAISLGRANTSDFEKRMWQYDAELAEAAARHEHATAAHQRSLEDLEAARVRYTEATKRYERDIKDLRRRLEERTLEFVEAVRRADDAASEHRLAMHEAELKIARAEREKRDLAEEMERRVLVHKEEMEGARSEHRGKLDNISKEQRGQVETMRARLETVERELREKIQQLNIQLEEKDATLVMQEEELHQARREIEKRTSEHNRVVKEMRSRHEREQEEAKLLAEELQSRLERARADHADSQAQLAELVRERAALGERSTGELQEFRADLARMKEDLLRKELDHKADKERMRETMEASIQQITIESAMRLDEVLKQKAAALVRADMEIQTMREEVERLNATVEDREKQKVNVKATFEEKLDRLLSEASATEARLRKEVHTMTIELECARNDAARAAQEYEGEAMALKREAEEEIAMLEKRIADMEAAAGELASQESSVAEGRQKLIDRLIEEKTQLEQDRRKLEHSLTELELEHEQLQSKRRELAARVSMLEQEGEDRETMLKEANASNDRLVANVEELTEKLEAMVKEHSYKVQNLVMELDNERLRRNGAEQSLAELHERALNDYRTTAQNEREELERTHRGLVGELERTISAMTQKQISLIAETNDLQNRLQSVNRAYQTAEEQMADMEVFIQGHRDELLSLNEAIQDKEELLEIANDEARRLSEQIEQLRDQIDVLVDQVRNAEMREGELIDQSASLEYSLTEAESARDDALSRLHAFEIGASREYTRLFVKAHQLLIDQHLAESYAAEDAIRLNAKVEVVKEQMSELKTRYKASLVIIQKRQAALPLPASIEEDIMEMGSEENEDWNAPLGGGVNDTPAAPLEIYESLILDLEARLAAALSDTETLGDEMQQNDEKIESLTQDLANARKDVERILESNREQKAYVEAIQGELEEARMMLDESEREREETTQILVEMVGQRERELERLRATVHQGVVDLHWALSFPRITGEAKESSNDDTTVVIVTDSRYHQELIDHHLMLSFASEAAAAQKSDVETLKAEVMKSREDGESMKIRFHQELVDHHLSQSLEVVVQRVERSVEHNEFGARLHQEILDHHLLQAATSEAELARRQEVSEFKDALKGHLSNLKVDHDRVRRELAVLKRAKQDDMVAVERLRARVEELAQQKIAAEGAVELEKADRAKEVAELKERILLADADVKSKVHQADEMAGDVSKRERDVEAAKAEAGRLRNELLTAVEKHEVAIEKAVREKEQESAEHRRALELLQNKIKSNEARIVELESDYFTLTRGSADAADKLGASDRELVSLRAEVERLRADVALSERKMADVLATAKMEVEKKDAVHHHIVRDLQEKVRLAEKKFEESVRSKDDKIRELSDQISVLVRAATERSTEYQAIATTYVQSAPRELGAPSERTRTMSMASSTTYADPIQMDQRSREKDDIFSTQSRDIQGQSQPGMRRYASVEFSPSSLSQTPQSSVENAELYRQLGQLTVDYHLTQSLLQARLAAPEVLESAARSEENEEKARMLENRVKDTEARLRARDSYMQQAISTTARQVQELEQKVLDLHAANEDLQREMALLEEERDRVRDHLASLDQENTMMQQELEEVSEELARSVSPTVIGAARPDTPMVDSGNVSELLEEYVLLRDIGSQTEFETPERDALALVSELSFATAIQQTQEETIAELELRLEHAREELERVTAQNWEVKLHAENISALSETRDKVIEELLKRIEKLELSAAAKRMMRSVASASVASGRSGGAGAASVASSRSSVRSATSDYDFFSDAGSEPGIPNSFDFTTFGGPSMPPSFLQLPNGKIAYPQVVPAAVAIYPWAFTHPPPQQPLPPPPPGKSGKSLSAPSSNQNLGASVQRTLMPNLASQIALPHQSPVVSPLAIMAPILLSSDGKAAQPVTGAAEVAEEGAPSSDRPRSMPVPRVPGGQRVALANTSSSRGPNAPLK